MRTGNPMSISTTDVVEGSCRSCAGTGWADPWELGDGTPELVSCDRCLGVGMEGCLDCDGDGVVAVAVSCPCQTAASPIPGMSPSS